jgi:hypothetical protein
MCPAGKAANEAPDHVQQLRAAQPAFHRSLRVGVEGDGQGFGADGDAPGHRLTIHLEHPYEVASEASGSERSG